MIKIFKMSSESPRLVSVCTEYDEHMHEASILEKHAQPEVVTLRKVVQKSPELFQNLLLQKRVHFEQAKIQEPPKFVPFKPAIQTCVRQRPLSSRKLTRTLGLKHELREI